MILNMNAQIHTIDHPGSTLKDLQIANNLRPALASKVFDEDGKKEILKEIRYLEGYQLPTECVVLIKEYLLLPKNIYLSKKIFIQNITKVSLSKLNDILFVHFNNKVMNLTNTIIPLHIRRSSICRLLLNKVDSNLIDTHHNDMYSKLNALYFNKSVGIKNDWIKQYDIDQDVYVWTQKPFKMRNKGKVINKNHHSITVALYKYITPNSNQTTTTITTEDDDDEDVRPQPQRTNRITELIWTTEIREIVIIKKSSSIMKIGENKWLDKVLENGLLIIH